MLRTVASPQWWITIHHSIKINGLYENASICAHECTCANGPHIVKLTCQCVVATVMERHLIGVWRLHTCRRQDFPVAVDEFVLEDDLMPRVGAIGNQEKQIASRWSLDFQKCLLNDPCLIEFISEGPRNDHGRDDRRKVVRWRNNYKAIQTPRLQRLRLCAVSKTNVACDNVSLIW